MNSFYSEDELMFIGFKSIGKNVLISKKCSIYGANNMIIGNNVRIDDFCILSGNIEIGNYVHISAYTALYGKGIIKIGNYCGCSPRCILFSQSDDFSGEFMISPIVDDEYTNVMSGPIILEDYSQLGANTIVLPKVIIKEGAVTGSMSLVTKDLEDWTMNIGIPSKQIKKRKKTIVELSRKFENSLKNE